MVDRYVKPYAKALLGALLAGLAALAVALADDSVTRLEAVYVASAVVATLIGVRQIPNRAPLE